MLRSDDKQVNLKPFLLRLVTLIEQFPVPSLHQNAVVDFASAKFIAMAINTWLFGTIGLSPRRWELTICSGGTLLSSIDVYSKRVDGTDGHFRYD